MVASTTADIYTPFQQTMISEEGPQSSEEGSGLHSPVFGAPYSTHGDSFRYQHDQLDVHHSTAMIATQYGYAHSLNAQQPPIIDSALELPNTSSARHDTFYAISSRNQLGVDFSVQPPVNSRIPPALHAAQAIDFRFSPTTERRLSSGHSHDHSYIRPPGTSSSMSMQGDHKSSLVPSSARSETSPAAEASTSPRDSRKEISSVVIACRQCRSRKIRCDSTRPVCNNCVRRSNECEYDLVPKRRGPDKRPGTRQRSCKKRPADGSAPPPPKRKRTASERPPTEQRDLPPSRAKENLQESKRSSPSSRHLDRHPQHPQESHYSHLHSPHPGQAPHSPTDLRMPPDNDSHYKHDISEAYRRAPPYMYDQGSYTKSSYPRQLDVNTLQFPDTRPHRKFPDPTTPIIKGDQKIWWDKILRLHSLNDIANEIHFLVQNTAHFLSFINTSFLIKQLHRDEDRLRIQPSFILAILAMAKLMKSSAIEEGNHGLQQAMTLATDAHSAFEEALNSHWLDATLVEAALILALFESSAHPSHSPGRATSALFNLDELIHNTTLTSIDKDDPSVSRFPYDNVPVVLVDGGIDNYGHVNEDRKCACFASDGDTAPDHCAHNPYSLPWDPNWTSAEIRDEEVRRLCWASLTLISEYVARCEAFNEDPPRFFLTEPSNFAVLFPGEVLDRASSAYCSSDSLSPKESVWALYCRSMLLWNFCNRFRQPSQDEDRAEHAQEAFLEAQSIEDSLNSHRCNLDTTLIYTCREYIHNTRMLVTQALRSSFHGLDNGRTTPGPVFKRKQAEDWLFYEDQVIRRVNAIVHTLHTSAAHQLTRRPFRINWFINQLAICLVLWTHDPTLDDALKLGKSILIPIDVLNALWPCASIQQRCDSLRQQLIQACSSRNIELPFPPEYSVPSFIRS